MFEAILLHAFVLSCVMSLGNYRLVASALTRFNRFSVIDKSLSELDAVLTTHQALGPKKG